MNLTGVTAHGAELAEILAILLVRHGYTTEQNQPTDLDALLDLARKAKEEPDDAYVLIQEGGSSIELYIHSHDSAEAAEDDRVSCAQDGAYRTSPVMVVSGALARTPGFYDALEEVLGLSNDLELVEVPDEEEAAD